MCPWPPQQRPLQLQQPIPPPSSAASTPPTSVGHRAVALEDRESGGEFAGFLVVALVGEGERFLVVGVVDGGGAAVGVGGVFEERDLGCLAAVVFVACFLVVGESELREMNCIC